MASAGVSASAVSCQGARVIALRDLGASAISGEEGSGASPWVGNQITDSSTVCLSA